MNEDMLNKNWVSWNCHKGEHKRCWLTSLTTHHCECSCHRNKNDNELIGDNYE